MGESNKQVRVDNWGVFFLQRLQVFFNKTDYCDLTLQFEGNVQLKVHRLVMSACTEYFSILEHTCEVIDGHTIVMPEDLQADVILPIVNFMYTGMLEFPMSLFEKLYRTAELMNIPILMKLLDAQRKPVRGARKQPQNTWQTVKKPTIVNKEADLPAMLPGRKLPVWKRKTVSTPPLRTASPQLFSTPITESAPKRVLTDPLALYDNTPKPTRFEWPEEDINSTFNLMDSSFNDISYTSKPLLTQDDELRASTSFDDTKYSLKSANKRIKEFGSNIDMNDVKDYVKEQKIRSDLGEYEEEDEDDPDNYLVERENKRKISTELSPVHTKKVRFTITEKENKEMTISVTPKHAGDMDHTKIISEVLKRYPHLVKKNKNIKLKIMAKSPVKEPTKTIMKALTPATTTLTKVKVLSPKESPKPMKAVTTKIVKPQPDEGPWICKKCTFGSTEPVEFVLYYLYRKHMTDVHHEKFDSKMCKHCGHQSSKHNLLMYHQYTKHGVKPPPAYNFPKCPRCPFIALTEMLLQKHLQSVHSKFDLQCSECKVAFNSQSSLLAHVQITGHTNSGRSSFDCQYCTKRFNSASDLFGHIRASHRDEARRDGMVSIDETGDMDEEEEDEDMDEFIPQEQLVAPQIKKPKSIEVVSNVKISEVTKLGAVLPTHTEPGVISTEVITDMEGNNQGLVDIVVLDENQQYILHNDQQLVHSSEGLVHSHPEYILPEIGPHEYNQPQSIGEVITTSQANVITQGMLHNSEIASTDELVMVLTDHDYNDANNSILTNENSNIVVLYSHPVDGQQSEFITSEGKLILNPQTGLLELRNDNTDSQDAQIESIELIQREINNGLIQRNPAEVPQTEEVSIGENDNYKENMDRGEVIDDKSGILNQQYETTATPEEQKSTMEEPMEIDESCNIQENDVNELTQIETRQEDPTENVDGTEEVIHSEDQLVQDFDRDSIVTENVSSNTEEKVDENVCETEIHGNEQLHSETPENVVEEISEENPTDVNHELLMQEQEDTPTTTQETNDVITEIQLEGNSEVTREVPSDVNPKDVTEIHYQKVSTETEDMNKEITNETPDTLPKTSGINPELAPESPEITHTEIHSEATSEGYELHSQVHQEIVPEMNVDATPSEITSEIITSEISHDSELQTSPVTNESSDRVEVENHPVEPNLISEPSIYPEKIVCPPKEIKDDREVPEIPLQNTSTPDIISNENQIDSLPSVENPEEIEFNAEVSENINTSKSPQEMIIEDPEGQEHISGEENQTQEDPVDQNTASQLSNILTEESNDVQKELIEENSTEQMNFEIENNRQLEEGTRNFEDMDMLIHEDTDQDKPEMPQDEREESIMNSSSIEYDMNKESMDIEMECSIDDNSQSQDSQTSQSSKELVPDYDKHIPNESTKISILNDWEDTEDSQQSDNPAKNIENTVNKLIGDWDDDDEEGQVINT